MSCFWDSLFRNLIQKKSFFLINHYSNKEYHDLYRYYDKDIKNVLDLSLYLKENNKFTHNVRWNGEVLTKKQLEENFQHVKDYDVKTINNGYLCSTFDPFLLLISEIYNVKIINNYMDYKIIYDNINSRKEITINNNNSHMW